MEAPGTILMFLRTFPTKQPLKHNVLEIGGEPKQKGQTFPVKMRKKMCENMKNPIIEVKLVYKKILNWKCGWIWRSAVGFCGF